MLGGTTGAWTNGNNGIILGDDSMTRQTFLRGFGSGAGFELERENSNMSVGASIGRGSSWTMDPVDSALTLPRGANSSAPSSPGVEPS